MTLNVQSPEVKVKSISLIGQQQSLKTGKQIKRLNINVFEIWQEMKNTQKRVLKLPKTGED